MKQYQAVIKTMEHNEGYATLGYLYKNVFKIENCEWKTKTPYASIRRIVQDNRFFFKIKPGLWALKSHKEKLPKSVLSLSEEQKNSNLKKDLSHSYYQGLIAEIGNIKKYNTYIPKQDKNKAFLNKKLYEICSMDKIFNFSYNYFVKKSSTIDVSWFNNRKMPYSFFVIAIKRVFD